MRNWRKSIAIAQRLKLRYENRYTGNKRHQAFLIRLRNDALSWNSCAVGERQERFKAKGFKFRSPVESTANPIVPINDTVLRLGSEFAWRISDCDWKEALKILDKLDKILLNAKKRKKS